MRCLHDVWVTTTFIEFTWSNSWCDCDEPSKGCDYVNTFGDHSSTTVAIPQSLGHVSTIDGGTASSKRRYTSTATCRWIIWHHTEHSSISRINWLHCLSIQVCWCIIFLQAMTENSFQNIVIPSHQASRWRFFVSTSCRKKCVSGRFSSSHQYLRDFKCSVVIIINWWW